MNGTLTIGIWTCGDNYGASIDNGATIFIHTGRRLPARLFGVVDGLSPAVFLDPFAAERLGIDDGPWTYEDEIDLADAPELLSPRCVDALAQHLADLRKAKNEAAA